MSRATDYTPELAEHICEKLIEGLSLRQICAAEDMPHRITVIRWMGKDPSFATKCARAREEQADLMDDRILEVIDKLEVDEIEPDVARVMISALQWRASKLKPKKYGDKLETTLQGPDGGPVALSAIVTDDPAEAARAYQRIIRGE